MKGKEHLLLGTATGLIAASAISAPHSAQAALAVSCMVGSLYPDIDLAASKMGSVVKPLSFMLNKMFGHRGFIHTPLNAALLCFVISFASKSLIPDLALWITGGFLLGFMIHLFQDTFTRRGIQWLFPIPFHIHFTNILSESPICTVITLILAGSCLAITRLYPIWITKYIEFIQFVFV